MIFKVHLYLECDVLGVANNLIHGRKIANGATNCPSMWTENNIHAVTWLLAKCKNTCKMLSAQI